VGRARAGLDLPRLAGDVQCAPGLFRWCLPGEIRGRLAAFYAEEERPESARLYASDPVLPEQTGGCWMMVAKRGGAPLLNEAFVLPLLWRPGPNDPRLPAALAALADELRGLLAEELDDLRRTAWGLQLAPVDGLDGLDLSWLDVQAESGAAALAAGLIAAVRGGKPDRDVWATGAWDRNSGRWHVDPDSLPAKIRLARDFRIRRLFVPRTSTAVVEQLAEAEGVLLEVMALNDTAGTLRPEENRLYVAVRPYLYAWMPEPAPDDDLEVRQNYFLEAFHDRRDRREAARFYIACLVDELVSKRRAWLADCVDLRDWQPTHFVTIYSPSFELVYMGTRLFRPRSCLLIHTASLGRDAGELAAQLNSPQLHCQTRSVSNRPTAVEEIERALAQFVDGVDPSQVLIDLTPGKRLMSLALQGAAPAGSRLLCWWHDTAEQFRRVIPGTEFPLIWRMSEDRRLVPLLVKDPDRPPPTVAAKGNDVA